jgi:hypothetical protein
VAVWRRERAQERGRGSRQERRNKIGRRNNVIEEE